MASSPQVPSLTPLPASPDHIPGRYASVDVSDQPMFGPDEMGELKADVDKLTESATRTDSSSRIWEILQCWEARLFERGYHFLQAGWRGWGLFGAGGTSPQSVMGATNNGKLFPVNVYGARCTKISSALAREIPPLKFSPDDPEDPIDQTASDEDDNYLEDWKIVSNIKDVVARTCRYFYTDGSVVFWTRSVADQQRWGLETPDIERGTFGAPEADGVTPETEMQPQSSGGDKPAVREITTAHGVLEAKRPIYADDLGEMGYVRIAYEQDVDILRERYPWIAGKIAAGQSVAGSSDQYDRMARINVRLAVQTSAASGETFLKDATETHTWFRPSQYRMLSKERQQIWYQNFPDGVRITHAGSEFAFARNEGVDNHIELRHSQEGDGQNRRALGTNYLPLQKILNQNMSLLVRYFVSCIPRRFADVQALDIEAINQQINDPSKITGVKLPPGQTIQAITGIENVPSPTNGLMEFVQWLVEGAPEVMDGAPPAMFGQEDAETFGQTRLNRDMALSVFSAPWAQICLGMAKCASQAAKCAATNRQTNIRSQTPGQKRLNIEIQNMQGDATCAPTSLEIPQSLAEQEAQLATLIEQAGNVALYAKIVNDPNNLPIIMRMPALQGLRSADLEAVEKQQGEFELLLQGGPNPNPELLQVQEQIQQITALVQQGQTHPEAMTPEGQQAMQQLQTQLQQLTQQVQTTAPLVSSVPVAQNAAENHTIEAAITWGKMNSPEGRKLKNNPETQPIYQNLELHWQEHEAMAAKLTPPQQIPLKGNVTIDPTKLPPGPQAKAWQEMGLDVNAADFENDDQLVPHEVITEKEGVDANGVPIKQKIAMTNPAGRLN